MNKKILTALSGVLLTNVAISGDVYTSLDADQNGVISQSEAAALPELNDRWKDLDVDANGELTVEEFAQFEIVEIPAPAMQEPTDSAPMMDATENK